MAFTLVQSKLAYNSATATFDNPVTAGNLVVVCVAEYTGHTTGLSDNKGNTYNEDITRTNALTIPSASIFSTIVGTGGSSFQITAASPGAYMGLVIAEYSGNAAAAVFHDGQYADFSGTTTPATPAVAVDQNDMLIVGCLTHNGAGGSLTPGSNYTTIQEEESAASAQPISAIHDLGASSDQVCDWTIYAGVVGTCVAASYYPVGDVTPPEATNLTEPNLRTTSDGASFDIQYNENIEPTSPSGFTVNVNGSFASGTWSRPSAATHRFTFTSTPAAGAAITASYTAGDVEDSAGNALDNFGSTVVVNMQKYPGAYISHLGCTAYFNGAITTGRYQTGDHYYTGDVYIVDINPSPTGYENTARNGCVINPTLARHPLFPTTHTICPWDGRATYYGSGERLTPPFKPLAGQSIVLTMSSTGNYSSSDASADPEGDPLPIDYVFGTMATGSFPTRSMAVITCVTSAPSEASFRPHFLSGTKTTYAVSSIDLSFLPNLPIPTGSIPADYDQVIRLLKRPACDFERNDWASHMVGAQNWPITYGREASWLYGDAFCLLCSDDITTEQKTTMSHYIIQRGIDLWGGLQCDDELFWANGGFKIGRKMPVLFAKRALGTSWNTDSVEFQDDQCTSFGKDILPTTGTLWTNWQNSGHPYAANVLKRVGVGTGIFYEAYPLSQWKDNPPSTPGDYCWNRQWAYSAQNCKSLVGEAIAARLMNLTGSWNHDAFFAMQDRWWYEPDSDLRDDMAAQAVADNWNVLDPEDDWTDVNNASWASRQGTGYSTFAGDMFEEYRGYEAPAGPDGAPSSLSASAFSTTQIDLTWNDNTTNEVGFTIERDTVNTFDSVNYVTVNVAVANTESYSATSLNPSTTYYFRVRAYNDDGVSSWSNTSSDTTLDEAVAPPDAAPSDLAASTVSSSRIDVVWSDNSSNEDGFTLQVDTVNTFDSGNLQEITLSGNVENRSVTSLNSNTTYYFRVRAYNGGGASSWSNTTSATTEDDGGWLPIDVRFVGQIYMTNTRRQQLRDFFFR